VRHHQRFRESQARRKLLDAADEIVDLGGERARVARIEHPRDCGRPDGCHIPM